MKLPRELGDLPYADALISHEGDLAAGEHYDGCHFTGLAITAARADNGRFVECAFSDVTLEDVSMRRSRLSDVWLRDVRLLSADLAESTWLDAAFIGCAAAGVQAFDSGLRRIVFHECKLGWPAASRTSSGPRMPTRTPFTPPASLSQPRRAGTLGQRGSEGPP